LFVLKIKTKAFYTYLFSSNSFFFFGPCFFFLSDGSGFRIRGFFCFTCSFGSGSFSGNLCFFCKCSTCFSCDLIGIGLLTGSSCSGGRGSRFFCGSTGNFTFLRSGFGCFVCFLLGSFDFSDSSTLINFSAILCSKLKMKKKYNL